MSITIKEGGNFKPTPEGICKAVCVDIVEMPNVSTMWGTKDLIRLVWETDNLMDDGRPFLVTKRYTPSLNVKATLRKDLKAWRGKDFSSDELAGFDIEKLIGSSCQLVIVHADGKDGNTYANISAIIKSKEKLDMTGKYIRVKDRPENKGVATIKAGSDLEDESIPF